MKTNNGHLFPRFQPMIARHQGVVLIGFCRNDYAKSKTCSGSNTRRCFTSGRDNFSRTEQLLLKASSPAPEFLMWGTCFASQDLR